MKRLLSLVVVASLVAVCGSCGNVFVRGSFQPGFSSISGLVSIVQLSFVTGDNGTMVQVTFVTFLQNGASSTLGFCGDQRGQFPLSQTVRADFSPGQPCDTIIAIVIIV